jgi:general secretion pathway protein G
MDLSNLATALDAFCMDAGRYPATVEGLDALVNRPAGLVEWHGPYLERIVADRWGTPFRYACPAVASTRRFDLISAGPDRAFGTDDDLVAESRP